MKIAFNPSTVAALIAPPNNKDITFDLRGHNIFARGVKFCGTDTNTWRDIKINNVSIDSNTLDLRDGSNTTLTNINGVVTINSTWRPVVDNLTSDSTTSSLSANQGRVLKALIDGKSDSGHTHDDRYVKKTGDTMFGALNFANGTWNLVGDDSYMGDCNISGHVGIKAANTTYPGISFFNNANAHLGNLTAYSGNIKYGAYSLQFLDNGNTNVSAGTWMNPFNTYNASAVADGQAICVWGQSSYLSNLATDTGDMSLWLKRVNSNVATLNMVLDGEYYANGNQRLAHVSEIPNSLKNPYALTISLNGTSQGPYDGSAAKNINITPSSIGAATSDHNHDGRYVRYYAVTTLDCNNLAVGLTAAGVSATNAAHTNHSAFLYISDVGTPFQIQIPDSSVPYIYKRYYSSGGWSGWFKLNAGYADSAGSASNLTVHQYLSNTDTTWWPLIWGGSSHNNTSDSTGEVYKSHDVLSWQTSSQTLYATNIQTENIKHLSIGGGIYWNPYVESASDGSDSASITLVKSGVAGGTTLVLSQMNDSNDTIQFQTNGSARLYHNSYPILTTQNTYVSNNKGYINGTEITQVNNANLLDGLDWNNFFSRRFYTFDLGSYSLSNFYPLFFVDDDIELDCEIHSNGGGWQDPYNQNRLHFQITSRGWTDTRLSFHLLSQDIYDINEITIGSIGIGTHQGGICIWVRGGRTYRVCSNREPLFRSSNYTYGDEIYSVGTNIWGGTNTNVNIVWKNDSTRKNALIATLTDNVASATKLATARKIWGQLFDGTADVDGELVVNGQIRSSFASNNGNPCIMVNPTNDTDWCYGIEVLATKLTAGHRTGAYWAGKTNSTNNAICMSYYHAGDGSEDNRLIWHTWGSGDKMMLTANGRVGIGATPSYKLHVDGDIYTTTGFKKNGSSDSYVLLGGGGHKLESSLNVTYSKYLTGITLTGGNGNNEGYRLIFERTMGGWTINHGVWAIALRHSGRGTLNIGFDTTNSDGSTYTYNIRFLGSTASRESTPFRAFYNTSTKVFRIYWHYYDYTSGDIAVLRGNMEPYNGTWMTSLPNDVGTELAITCNMADQATNADTVDGYHASGLFTALSNSDNGISITVGGTTKSVSNISVNYASSAGNADTVDGYHASSLVKFYLSPMTNDAPADSAKSWFINTMPSASGAIVYNVPGSEKTIIAGKSSGAYGHMLQLNYDNTYLRVLRYYNGSWKSTDWEKISAGYADSAGSASKVYGQVGDTGSHELVRCDMNNDQFRIIAGSSGNNNGWAEIATADDGNEPIYVRQYTGVFSSVRRTLTLLDGSGNTTFPGSLSIGGQIIREGSGQTWVNGRNGALLRETSVAGYHTLWSLKTTNGSWDFGEYNAGNYWDNIPVLSYITDSNYNSGNNTPTYQIRFPLASGTVALTSNIPNPTNYYWANVKISASSSTTTSPTVHTLTATRVCAGHNPEIDNSISCSNWFRSSGDTGWYNTTYQGGWYMSDTSWIRAHNGVGIYTSGQIYSSSSIKMGNILLEHTDEINNSTNGGIHLNYRNSGNITLCYGGGNVGIGTPSPTYKLDVNGQVRASGFRHSSVNSDNYMLLAGGGYKSFGGDDSHPIFLGYLNLDHGNNGTISSSFYCLGYSVPFTYTRGGNYCRISIPDTSYQVFYIRAAIASVNYSGGGMDTWTGYRRGAGAWWLHCYVSSLNEVRVKGFRQANDNNDSWWGGNPLVSDNSGANRITVCIFGNVTFR